MTRIMFLGLLSASISGCAGVHDAMMAGVHPVDCSAVYTSRLGAGAEIRTATVPIKYIRADKNGTIWVKPQNTFNVRFAPGWKSTEHFTNYQCNGEDYGLRRSAL